MGPRTWPAAPKLPSQELRSYISQARSLLAQITEKANSLVKEQGDGRT